jgi:hypothetical protein
MARRSKPETEPRFPPGSFRIERTKDLLESYRMSFQQGNHEALKYALGTAISCQIPLPEWLGKAVFKLISNETPRQAKAREQREIDFVRAIAVITRVLNDDVSFEEAYEAVAAGFAKAERKMETKIRYTAGPDTMKRATDWFFKQKDPIVTDYLARLRAFEATQPLKCGKRSKRIG